jgi:hypothetical protein
LVTSLKVLESRTYDEDVGEKRFREPNQIVRVFPRNLRDKFVSGKIPMPSQRVCPFQHSFIDCASARKELKGRSQLQISGVELLARTFQRRAAKEDRRPEATVFEAAARLVEALHHRSGSA